MAGCRVCTQYYAPMEQKWRTGEVTTHPPLNPQLVERYVIALHQPAPAYFKAKLLINSP